MLPWRRRMYSGGTCSRPQDSGGWQQLPGSPLHCASCGGFVPAAGGKAGAGAITAAAGRARERRGRPCGPSEPGCLLSPRSLLWIRRHTAAFSASKCPAVTGKPSSGGGGSLRGTRRLCGSRETWHFRGLALSLSHVGEPCLQVPFGPLPCVHPGVPALLLGRHRSGGGRRRTVLARFP